MNENKFDEKGAVYAKARPHYPDKLFADLMNKRIITADTVVADIGAGTGIFTSQIAPLVRTVYAVEPNSDMRTSCESCLRSFDNVTFVDAAAETTTLQDSSVDFVTVAQAFHWFDRVRFKTECKRILTSNGSVLLVWNDRDIRSDVIAENFAVNRRFCPHFKGSSNGIDFDRSGFVDFFEGDFEIVQYENRLIYDPESFISRNLSSSYAPKPTDRHYEAYIEAVRRVFETYSRDGLLEYPYITRCYIGNV